MSGVAGAVTEETILRQCITMSKNSRIDAFMWYFGSTYSLDIRVNLDTTYIKGVTHNIIYRGSSYDKTLAEILKDLIAIEYQYEQKQTALNEERLNHG